MRAAHCTDGHRTDANARKDATMKHWFPLLGLLFLLPPGAKAADVDTRDVQAGGTAVGDLVRIPVKAQKINEFISMASGLSFMYLIETDEGNILIDTGFAHHAKPQADALEAIIEERPVTHIILPQGQHDDVGGIPFWKDDDTKIVMTRAAYEYMPWRKQIAPFLAHRFVTLYDWAAQLDEERFPFEPIEPDLIVEQDSVLKFEQGGVELEVIPLPGAEGKNSAGVYLPQHKILFVGGGVLGPVFPMWPNLGTVRADRDRSLDAYLASLEKLRALDIELILAGNHAPIAGKEKIETGLAQIHGALTFVRGEVIEGMNQGKDVYQLMREIRLPEEYADLDQSHGRVEWTIRQLVNDYGGWFRYRQTSELYPWHVEEVYPDVVAAAGGSTKLLDAAQARLAAGQPVQAMQLVEIVRSVDAEDARAIALEREVLGQLLAAAQAGKGSFSEIAWIQSRLRKLPAPPES